MATGDVRFYVQVLTYVLWVASVVALIKVDGARVKKAREADGGVDFMDRSPWPYLALTFICGGLVLPVYFRATRGKNVALLTGLLWTVITMIAAGTIGTLAGIPMQKLAARHEVTSAMADCDAQQTSYRCSLAADLLLRGVAVPADPALSLVYREKSCLGGYFYDCALAITGDKQGTAEQQAKVPALIAAQQTGCEANAASNGGGEMTPERKRAQVETCEAMSGGAPPKPKAASLPRLPKWPGWPLPAGTEMTPDVFCLASYAMDQVWESQHCTDADLAAERARNPDGFSLGSTMEHAFVTVCDTSITRASKNGRVKLDSSAGVTCVDALYQRSNAPGSSPMSAAAKKACEDYLDGEQAAGAPCREPFECQTGLSCVGYTPSAEGKCAPTPTAGEVCGLGKVKGGGISLVLDNGDHPECQKGAECSFNKCEAQGAAGAHCSARINCLDGLDCESNRCNAPKPPAALGGACTDNEGCAGSLVCERVASAAHGKCIARKAAGAACTTEPNSAQCNGACDVPKGADAGTCVARCGSG